MKTHLNNAVPSCIAYNRFTVPFLWDDPIFVDEYNDIIRQSQKKIIEWIVNRCEKTIEFYESELLTLKTSIKSFPYNLNKMFDDLKQNANNDPNKFLDAGSNKVIR